MIESFDLSGFWEIRFDEKDEGKKNQWYLRPPKGCRKIHLPSCWNESFPEFYRYDGTAWFFKQHRLHKRFSDKRIMLCFEGVNYFCELYINGKHVGTHEGGFTYFSFDITSFVAFDDLNLIAIRVNGRHSPSTIPPPGVDWFNYNGIYRPLYLAFSRFSYIADYTIKTKVDGNVSVDVLLKRDAPENQEYSLNVSVTDQVDSLVVCKKFTVPLLNENTGQLQVAVKIPEPHPWNLGSPYLYQLTMELMNAEGILYDRIQKRFGLREFVIHGHQIMINGKAVKLVGCSKHDEYPTTGRTVTREQLAHDYMLFCQMNANFVRLCHYPHNRLEHELLNELGIVSMAEIPLVFLHEEQMTNKEVLEKAKQMLTEMVQTEKNETNIMFWSVFIECDTHLPSTQPFVQEIIQTLKSLDNTRFIVAATKQPLVDKIHEKCDIIGVNYWEGWYRDAPVEQVVDWLTRLSEDYPQKPLLITSHGWDGIYQVRSYMEKIRWSEDSQSDYLSRIADVFMSFKNTIGEIVWTFADFRSSLQEDAAHPLLYRKRYLERPCELNHKGMLSYFRQPKSTYYVMQNKFSEWNELTIPPKTVGKRIKVRTFSNQALLSRCAAFDFIDKVQALLKKKKFVHVLLAPTPHLSGFFQTLIQNRMFVEWNRIVVYPLYEYIDLDPNSSAELTHFLKIHLLDHLPIARFEALKGKAKSIETECMQYNRMIEKNRMDITCIGIGENELYTIHNMSTDNLQTSQKVRVADIEETVKKQLVARDYFSDMKDVPKNMLIWTVPAMMQTNSLLCIGPDSEETKIILKLIQSNNLANEPLHTIRSHKDVTFYLKN